MSLLNNQMDTNWLFDEPLRHLLWHGHSKNTDDANAHEIHFCRTKTKQLVAQLSEGTVVYQILTSGF